MKTLFELLEAIIKTGREDEILSDPGNVISFASECKMSITQEMAESIINLRKDWADSIESVAEDEDDLRGICEQFLECLMDPATGDVKTVEYFARYNYSLERVEWNGEDWV